jgi:tetratricopeptide (TPR) repeat protein
MRIYLLLIILIQSAIAQAQGTSYFDKGKSHFENKEYREALYCFNKYAKNDSTNAELFKMRGNCFYQLNLLDSAEADYRRVTKLSENLPEVYYNLSNIFALRNDLHTAEIYMRRFLKIRPDDGDALFGLSSLLKGLGNDSSFFFLQKAWSVDTVNQEFYNTIAWERFERGEVIAAQVMARNGRNKFRYTNELMPLEAYASFVLGDFREAIKVADTLVERQSDRLAWHILKCKAEILYNTPREKVSQNRFTFRVKEYFDNNKDFDNWVTDPQHPYYYAALKDKFKANIDAMSLNEFLMLYYGATTDNHYSPYAPLGMALMDEITENTSDEEKINIYQRVLEADPFNLSVYQNLASVAFALKQMDIFGGALKRYLGLTEAILATGNGKSTDSAYFVISTRDEYAVLAYQGLQSTQQALLDNNGHNFDRLSAMDENNEKHDVYFNIDKMWESLSKSFSNSKSGAGKNSAGKKKKRRNRD